MYSLAILVKTHLPHFELEWICKCAFLLLSAKRKIIRYWLFKWIHISWITWIKDEFFSFFAVFANLSKIFAMSVQTILLDFSIEPSRISDDESRKNIVKLLENGLTEHFPQLKLCYELTTADGSLVLFTENQLLYFHVRLFNHGIITVNVEYFKSDATTQIISFDVSTYLFYIVQRHWWLHRIKTRTIYPLNWRSCPFYCLTFRLSCFTFNSNGVNYRNIFFSCTYC